MVLDKIKNEEPIESAQDIFDEIKNLYNPEDAIDYSSYEVIPSLIQSIRQDNEDKLMSAFLEEALLILLYMTTKELPREYLDIIGNYTTAAEVVVNLKPLVEHEYAFNLLESIYNRYISNSLSLAHTQMKMIKDLEDLNLDQIKDIINSLDLPELGG